MKFLLLINSSKIKNVSLEKVGMSFRQISSDEYDQIINFLNYLVTDDMVEKALSFGGKDVTDIYLSYQFALTFTKPKITFAQEQFLKLIIKSGSKQKAIDEFIDLKNAVVCETNDIFCKYFQNYDAIQLINSIIGFIQFITNKTQDKTRENVCSSLDDFLKGGMDYSFLFYTNGLYWIDCEMFNNFIDVLNSYNAEFQFYFLNNLLNLFNNNDGLNITKMILDDISTIELLLLNDKEDKKANFVLKCGILCRDTFSDETNESLKMRLEGLYEIRSHLVHGSTQLLSKLESKYGPYLDLTKIEKEKTLRGRQNNLLISATVYLDLYLNKLFNKFITDNELFRFIKDN